MADCSANPKPEAKFCDARHLLLTWARSWSCWLLFSLSPLRLMCLRPGVLRVVLLRGVLLMQWLTLSPYINKWCEHIAVRLTYPHGRPRHRRCLGSCGRGVCGCVGARRHITNVLCDVLPIVFHWQVHQTHRAQKYPMFFFKREWVRPTSRSTTMSTSQLNKRTGVQTIVFAPVPLLRSVLALPQQPHAAKLTQGRNANGGRNARYFAVGRRRVHTLATD